MGLGWVQERGVGWGGGGCGGNDGRGWGGGRRGERLKENY